MTETIPHPRETFDWLGSDRHEQAFLDALARGRLHHAWLVVGPSGVGKSTFAYRAARRLLGAAPDASQGRLGAAADDRVSRQIIGRAHPDLLVLQRDPEDGKTRRNIPVDEARGLAEFFSKSPAAAPFRVAIIDTADDLNVSAANALLKTMEEPPSRGVIFLVSQSPGALLPTIRSRCRRLAVAPPERTLAASWVATRAGVDPADAERLLDMARGAPGAAWRLGAAKAFEVAQAAAAVMQALPGGDAGADLALADGFRGPLGGPRFALFFDRLADLVKERIIAGLGAGEAPGRLDAWSRAWSEMTELKDRTEAINLDRGEALFVTLSRLRALG